MSLHSLHVPLIDHCDDILCLYRVEISEDTLISLINEDTLLLGSDLTDKAYKIVDSASIDGLRKGLSSSHVKSVEEIVRLGGPA